MTAISVQYDAFQNGLPRGISNVVRDGSNRLTNWIENGYAMTIVRDGSGHPLTLVAKGQSQLLQQTFAFDPSTGLTISTGGAQIPTSLIAELFGAGTNGSGGTPSTQVPNALGTAAIGSSTAFMRADAVLPLPTAAAINAFGLPLQWRGDLNTNPTLVYGVAPVGDNTFEVTGCPTPVSSSISPYFTTLVNGDVVFYDGTNFNKWSGVSPPTRNFNYTPSAAYTTAGSVESGALATLSLGPLAIGSRVQLKLGEFGNANGNATIMKVYLNGVVIFTSGSISFIPVNPGWIWDFDFLVISGTSVQGLVKGVGSSSSNAADRVIGSPTISGSTNTITVTLTIATTGPATGIEYIDSTVF